MIQDPFEQKKQSILKEINDNDINAPDASPKGTIDEICIPIINLINSNEDMVTTSSCSGRVSVFAEGIKNINDINDIQIGAKGNHGHWIFVTHDRKSLPNWYKTVDFKYKTDESTKILSIISSSTRYILFKFEPLILHVKCRDLKSANALYSSAMGCGFRESGIGSNNIVGIRISIKLDVPIGFLNKTESGEEELISFVTPDYLEVITKLSDDRFKENFKKLDTLYLAIEKLNDKSHEAIEHQHVETKEERKERKIKEGMARREGVLAEKEKKRKAKLEELASAAKKANDGSVVEIA